MTDLPPSDGPQTRQEHVRENRIEGIRLWIEYIEEQPPDVWGEQLNTLVDAQLQAARDADIPAEQYRRVERAGDMYRKTKRE